MKCPACDKEVVADRLFCTWCEAFIPRVGAGTKAGLFRRWFASAIDPFLILMAILVPAVIAGGIGGESMGVFLAVIAVVAVFILFFKLFVRGMTPGKYLLGERVVERSSGENPGFGKMFVREVVGKFVSGLFLGLGFSWAIWDEDAQAWHDKIAGTVVVKRTPASVLAPEPVGSAAYHE